MDGKLEIRRISPAEHSRAKAFYQTFGYEWKPDPSQYVWIAQLEDAFLGIVRICEEQEFFVLRGMFIQQQHQRKGIGTQMLKQLEPTLESRITYCLPYHYLIGYYGQIGFRHIPEEEAPLFLQERLKVYAKRFEGLVIVKRESNGIHGLNRSLPLI